MAPVAHPRLALRRFTSTLAAAVGSTGSQRAVLLRQTAQAKIRAVEGISGRHPSLLNPQVSTTPSLPVASLKVIQQVNPLIDTFNRTHDYLRISLTERCNLRCFYCMPEEGIDLSPRSDILSDDEIVRLARLFVYHGVKKIRLTGGEPTVRAGLQGLIDRLNALRPLGLQSIAMTSNGLALHRKLPQLAQNGLTHLNLSLDTLDPHKFEAITRRRGHEAVMKTLFLALQLPQLQTVKLNVVVVKGINDSEVPAFVELTQNHNLVVRFIEFMPFSGNRWQKDKLIPSSDLLSQITHHHPGVTKVEDELNDTARSYRVPGFNGSFGFISSMSDHFCHTCNRLRITADGKIKVCLFDGAEISLRDHMRSGASDEQLSSVIGYAVGNKKEKHEAMEEIDTFTNRPMILIGGHHVRRPHAGRPSERLAAASRSVVLSGLEARTFSTSSRSASDSSGKLTHVDSTGRPSMVDVSDKATTRRSATATGRIHLTPESFSLVYPDTSPTPSSDLTAAQRKALSKGPVLITAQLAGILAAKQTSTLIPLCHPISLTHIHIDFTPEEETHSIRCEARVGCEGKTGVEMEALMGVNGALLCIWDMLKAVAGDSMRITDVKVTKKSGGRSGDWVRVDE